MIIYGRNVIREAIACGIKLTGAYIVDSPNLSAEMGRLETVLRDGGTPVERLPVKKLESVCHSREHQGIAAKIKEYRYSNTSEVLDGLDHPPFIVILDRVQDPHNVGAIVRIAYGAGADLLILAFHGGCLVTPAVLKTSAGYAFRMPVAVEKNISTAVRWLKKHGVWVYGAEMEGASCFEADLRGPLALVVGNEGAGVRRGVLAQCDGTLRVPMARKMDSLNVAVSAAVIAFKVMEARTQPRR